MDMDDNFNPLDLLECDVVEEEGEVQIPDINKDGIEYKDGNGEVSTEVECYQPYFNTPEPIFDCLQYTVYQPPPTIIVYTDANKNTGTTVQQVVGPKLVYNAGNNIALKLWNPAARVSSQIQSLPSASAAPTALKIWNPPSVSAVPKLVPIPRPIPSTSVAPSTSTLKRWNPTSSEVQKRPSTFVASPSASVTELEKDPLAPDKRNNPTLLCSYAETSFRCELQRHISKYSITFFRLHCTSCGSHINSTLYTVDGSFKMHKFLRVLVCQKCSEYYGNGLFPIEEGSEIYCHWCGNGGKLYCCSTCPKTFCKTCVIRNFGLDMNKQIQQKETWSCFVCDFYMLGKLLWIHRAIPALLQKHIKLLRSEATLLDGEEKSRLLKQDFSLCCMNSEVTKKIEVALPYSLYSKIPQHLVTKLYKLVCIPGTEQFGKKQSLVIAEETRPGCVSVEQKSVGTSEQVCKSQKLMTALTKDKAETKIPMIDLTEDSSLLASARNIKWLSQVFSDTDQCMNDFQLKLSYCKLYSNNMNNVNVHSLFSNLESLFSATIESMKKIYNNVEQEKNRILQGNSNVSTNTKEPADLNNINMTDGGDVDPLLCAPHVLQTENKENQFNKNNVAASVRTVETAKGINKVNSNKKNQSSSTSLSRKRKLENHTPVNDSKELTDYKYLFKKYKLKNCNVVLTRTDFTNKYKLKKCNVVLKKTDLTGK